jgi:ATP-dependent RNA helicase DeaD
MSNTTTKESITFSDLGVAAPILRGLNRMGFKAATPVQCKSIGPMSEGRDIIVQAPTGTGKTCAFGIPAIDGVDKDSDKIQTLILCPTRELAVQTATVLHQLTACMSGIRILAIYGGEPINRQIMALKKRPQIIVATPGRMKDHIQRKTTRLDHIKLVVLDEADRMLDMGFRDDIRSILETVPTERQTVLFSATMPHEILQIAKTYQKEVEKILIAEKQQTVGTVKQYYSHVQWNKKEATLVRLLRDQRYGLSLVFVSRKHMADAIAKTLNANNINAAALHGDMRQNKRDLVMKQYRTGQLNVLVATDVAARGIDVNNIDAVINFDLPQDSDSYVHRIGRTGRAEETGVAYTFLTENERGKFSAMVRRTNAEVPAINLEAAVDFISGKKLKDTSLPKTKAAPTPKAKHTPITGANHVPSANPARSARGEHDRKKERSNTPYFGKRRKNTTKNKNSFSSGSRNYKSASAR